MKDSGSTGFCVMSLYQQGLKLPADRSGKNVRLSPDKLRRSTFFGRFKNKIVLRFYDDSNSSFTDLPIFLPNSIQASFPSLSGIY